MCGRARSPAPGRGGTLAADVVREQGGVADDALARAAGQSDEEVGAFVALNTCSHDVDRVARTPAEART